jgi:hypothetical protein
MTERDFAEDLGQLLSRGLIEVELDLDHPVDEGPRFQPTAAGRAEIARGIGSSRCARESVTTYETSVTPRPADVDGGWRLRLLENGEEVGGGVFPAGTRGYIDAREEADGWLFSRDGTRA